ncbi:MAG: N-acetylmuramoyl-L-alanine amidase, partial [Acetanaerobacterium sp.]
GDGGAKYYDIANPDVRELFADAAGELVKGYSIDGILLDTDVYPKNLNDSKSYSTYGGTRSIDEFRSDNVSALVGEVSGRIENTDASVFFGVAATSDAYSLDNPYDTAAWINDGLIDCIVPRLYTAIGYGQDDFKTRIEGWEQATYGTPVLLMPALNSAAVGDITQSGGSFMDPSELMYQIMMARSCYSDGHVYSDITSLMKNPLDMFGKVYRLYLDNTVSDRTSSFTVNGKLDVTRPSANISVSSSTYFILGTSNPNQDLYVDGKRVTNRGSGGTFGVYLDIPVGTTTVNVTQGSTTITRAIKRSAGGGVIKISKITQNSMQPTSMGMVNSGQDYEVKCIAPSGGDVTAKLGDSVCTLKQVAATAESGVPATFKGTLTVSGDYSESRTTNLGEITYTLQYGGNTSSYTSSGDLFFVGANTTASVRMLDDITLIYKSADSTDGSLTNFRKDTTDYIAEETDTMFGLAMGGYVKKSSVMLVEGETLAAPVSDGVVLEKDRDSESYVIKGGAGIPFLFSRADGKIDVSLYNIKGLGSFNVSQSELFSSCSMNGQTATFTLKSGVSLGGCNLSYRGNDAVLFFKKAPSLSNDADKPLAGVTVVLDPGHGGVDPGAIGPEGVNGTVEKNITLAVAQRTRGYLQDLGAQVYLTRLSDTGATQADRAGLGEKVKADFFVSVHANSAVESSNSNKITGVEVYYYASASGDFAHTMMSQLTSATGRPKRNVYRSTYVVTRTYYAPSVLCELGFMSNPSEYEDMLTSGDIDREAYALAQGILKSM